jgi:thioredoxin-related protein
MAIFRILTLAAIIFAIGGGFSVAEPVPQEKKSTPEEQKPAGVQWRTDYNAARKEAVERKRPILIFFWKDSALVCAKLMRAISEHAELTKFLNSRMIPLRINGPEEGVLADRLQISLYPTIIFADSDGKIRETHIGYIEADDLLAKLRKTFPEPK